jgi:hypothetical protein
MVVIGHSGATGYDSDPSDPGSDATQNSWATGTKPVVDSVCQRLIAKNPAYVGHSVNLAQDGADIADMIDQAHSLATLQPRPGVVFIQGVDNDIRCDGTDPPELRLVRGPPQDAAEVHHPATSPREDLPAQRLGHRTELRQRHQSHPQRADRQRRWFTLRTMSTPATSGGRLESSICNASSTTTTTSSPPAVRPSSTATTTTALCSTSTSFQRISPATATTSRSTAKYADLVWSTFFD